MSASPWHDRIRRARELADSHPSAREILEFYIAIAQFQEKFHRDLSSLHPANSALLCELEPSELSELAPGFGSFLTLAIGQGPKQLSVLSRELHHRGPEFWTQLLQQAWTLSSPSDAPGFMAWTFLQPYAELKRSGMPARSLNSAPRLCPFCNRRPAVAVLRQMGDGGARSLVCSFCLAEWDFRRIVCPGCGEEDSQHLPVFNADDFGHIRLACCDTCKTYTKTIDFTRNGHADPIADDLATVALDLWVRDRGYARLQQNFLGL